MNGWFIGYIEIVNNTYFFATNIGADNNATGSNAAEITMSILSDMNIWTHKVSPVQLTFYYHGKNWVKANTTEPLPNL